MGKDVELKIQIIPCHLLLILNRHPPRSSSLALSLPPCVLGLSELWSILDRNSIYPLNLCLSLQEFLLLLSLTNGSTSGLSSLMSRLYCGVAEFTFHAVAVAKRLCAVKNL